MVDRVQSSFLGRCHWISDAYALQPNLGALVSCTTWSHSFAGTHLWIPKINWTVLFIWAKCYRLQNPYFLFKSRHLLFCTSLAEQVLHSQISLKQSSLLIYFFICGTMTAHTVFSFKFCWSGCGLTVSRAILFMNSPVSSSSTQSQPYIVFQDCVLQKLLVSKFLKGPFVHRFGLKSVW